MRPDAKLGRPDAPMWSLQMRIIIIWGAVMRLIRIWIARAPPHVQL